MVEQPNDSGAKIWILSKRQEVLADCKTQSSTQLFGNTTSTSVSLTTEGRIYLGAPLGCPEFHKKVSKQKVSEWCNHINNLSTIATTQPQAAYSVFVQALKGKWTYAMRTNNDISDCLQPLENIIQSKLIPSITGRAAPGEEERQLFSLPTRMGGLGLFNPLSLTTEYDYSRTVTQPLVNRILQQQTNLGEASHEQAALKNAVKTDKQQKLKSQAETLEKTLSPQLQRTAELAKEKGASSWLNVLPIERHGFSLHKSAFRDALCLRYGWRPPHLCDECPCGKQFSVDHALSCPTGGYPTIRHNEIRDVTAHFLGNVCHDVQIEPKLQPLNGETFSKRCGTTDDEARLDIAANGFWGGRFQKTLFDVRVFNPTAPTYKSQAIPACYRRQEQEKKRKYEERVTRVEHASFTPIVFSVTGGCSRLTSTFIKRLASLTAEKDDSSYAITINWIRCRLRFALLRSAIMCLRGSRRRKQEQASDNILLATAEGRL